MSDSIAVDKNLFPTLGKLLLNSFFSCNNEATANKTLTSVKWYLVGSVGVRLKLTKAAGFTNTNLDWHLVIVYDGDLDNFNAPT